MTVMERDADVVARLLRRQYLDSLEAPSRWFGRPNPTALSSLAVLVLLAIQG